MCVNYQTIIQRIGFDDESVGEQWSDICLCIYIRKNDIFADVFINNVIIDAKNYNLK